MSEPSIFAIMVAFASAALILILGLTIWLLGLRVKHLSGVWFKFASKGVRFGNVNVIITSGLTLILLATSLTVFNILNVDMNLTRLVIAMLVSSLLSGYAILVLAGLSNYFSKLELIPLSYLMGFIFSAFLYAGLLIIDGNLRPLIIAGSYITLGILTAVKGSYAFRESEKRASLAGASDILLLSLILLLYAVWLLHMYPGFSYRPGTDISRHYAMSQVLSRTPELYHGFAYLLFHLFQAAVYSLSYPYLFDFQSLLVLFNLTMPLAFYIMSKSYLEEIDERLPILSTIFFSLFSGFAWIYGARLMLEGVDIPEIAQLVNDKAYNGAMYLAQPILWYVPLSVSFTILMIQILLLKRLDIPRNNFIALFSILTCASYLIHPPETVTFALFISAFSLVSRNEKLRLKDTLLASLLGFTIARLVFLVAKLNLGLSFTLSLTLPMITLFFSYLYRMFNLQERLIPKVTSSLSKPALIKSSLYLTLLTYILGLLVWISEPSFNTWRVADVGLVPWFIYPVALGITGLLAVVGLLCIAQDRRFKRALTPFIALMVFTLIFGRAVSYVNINFFETGYWEKRFISFIFLGSSLIAPISVTQASSYLERHKNKISKITAVVLLTSLVLVSGLLSSFVVVGYWSISSSPERKNRPSEEELQAINFLSSVFRQDKYAYAITITNWSYHALVFASPPYQPSRTRTIYAAENPEIPLAALRVHKLTHAYLYMHNRDFELLNKYGESWLANHLIPMLPVVFMNNEVMIYNASSVSFPVGNSSTTLVVPFVSSSDAQEPWLYAYDVLSQGEFHYTIAYDLDPQALNNNIVVLSIDPLEQNITYGSQVELKYLDYVKEGGYLVVLNTNGYGFFSQQMFESSNSYIKAEDIETIYGEKLPATANVIKLNLKSNEFKPLAYYVSSDGQKTVYAVEGNVGLGKLVYVNVYPLIDEIAQYPKSRSSTYQILGKLLRILNLNLMSSNYAHPPTSAVFEEAKIVGDIEVKTSSIIFPLNVVIDGIDVETQNGDASFYNISRIEITGYKSVSVTAENLLMKNGKGFYATLNFNETVQISPIGDDVVLKLTSNSQEYTVISILGFRIRDNSIIQIYAREPVIESHGDISFKELYTTGEIYQKMRVYGQDLVVEGTILMSVYMADTYTFANSFSVEGSYQRKPSLISYDEFTSFPRALLYGLLLLPFLIAIVLLQQRMRRNARAYFM